MKKEAENKNELVTYGDICEEAFEPTIDLMMKKYDVLSMTNVQLGDAYQEVRDAVKKRSEEFVQANKKVIEKLLYKYKKLGLFDIDTHPDVIDAKEKELSAKRLREAKKRLKINTNDESHIEFNL